MCRYIITRELKINTPLRGVFYFLPFGVYFLTDLKIWNLWGVYFYHWGVYFLMGCLFSSLVCLFWSAGCLFSNETGPRQKISIYVKNSYFWARLRRKISFSTMCIFPLNCVVSWMINPHKSRFFLAPTARFGKGEWNIYFVRWGVYFWWRGVYFCVRGVYFWVRGVYFLKIFEIWNFPGVFILITGVFIFVSVVFIEGVFIFNSVVCILAELQRTDVMECEPTAWRLQTSLSDLKISHASEPA